MNRQVTALLLATVPIPFMVFGAGHFYLRRFREGILFFVAAMSNWLLSFSYLPFEIESLLGPNFLEIISRFDKSELMFSIVTICVWSGLIAASIVRVGHLSKNPVAVVS